MGYFPNGSSGMDYEARYCSKCVHQATEDRGCPVMDLHALYNYDQHKKPSTKAALEMLIPRDGVDNGQCRMFWSRTHGRGGDGQPVPVPLQIVRAA